MHLPEWGPPEPIGARSVSESSPWRWVVLAVLGIAGALAAFFLPIPIFYQYLPGPAPTVDRLVDISGARTYSSEGSFLITTVSVDTEVTFVDIILSALDDDTAVVTKEQVTGGRSLDRLRREQEEQMRSSGRHSKEVALAALGLGRPQGDGARVVDTIADSPARGVLQKGDIILSVDGRRVSTTCDVGRAIDAHKVGDTVRIEVRRNGAARTFTVDTGSSPDSPDSPYIGVYMEDVNYRFTPGVDVAFRTGDIAGPSAGLMFALSLYDQLTPEDLTDGRKVAGTGTIGCDGGVGPIGGIEQKVAGAEEQGADVFLAPSLNAPAAREAAGAIDIVAVATFDDAIEYLEGLD